MLLKLVAHKSLLVLELLLCVLVALENLIVLDFAKLQPLVHLAFKLLSQGSHLDLLLLHHFSFGRENLFMAVLHVLLALLFFHLVGSLLNLMSLLIVLLLGEINLDLTQVE